MRADIETPSAMGKIGADIGAITVAVRLPAFAAAQLLAHGVPARLVRAARGATSAAIIGIPIGIGAESTAIDFPDFAGLRRSTLVSPEGENGNG